MIQRHSHVHVISSIREEPLNGNKQLISGYLIIVVLVNSTYDCINVLLRHIPHGLLREEYITDHRDYLCALQVTAAVSIILLKYLVDGLANIGVADRLLLHY